MINLRAKTKISLSLKCLLIWYVDVPLAQTILVQYLHRNMTQYEHRTSFKSGEKNITNEVQRKITEIVFLEM